MLDFFTRMKEWVEDHLNWKIIGTIVVAVAVLAFFGGSAYQDWRAEGEGLELVKETSSEEATEENSDAASTTGEVVVHVAGAVSAPGVYTLPANARVDDAVRTAGATAEADLAQLNLAQKLTDGQKITVPEIASDTASAEAAASGENEQTGSSLVNINTATVEELDALPGIGEVRAQAIVSHREANGPFPTLEALKEVTGIGEKIYADLAPYITI